MLKCGIIGLGNLGQNYISLMKQDPRTELVGVFDINARMSAEISGRENVPAHDSLGDLLDAKDLDLVYVATPDSAHKEAVIEAAQRGLNILVEKPLATSLADAEEMAEAVRKAGVKLFVAFSNRYNQPFIAAKNQIEAGRVGDILSINAKLNDTVFVPTEYLSWAANSSPAWFLMSHTMDAAWWFSQKEVKSVYATGVRKVLVQRGINTWDSLHAVVQYADDTQGFFESTWVLPNGKPLIFDLGFGIVGTKGAIDINTHDQMMHYFGDRFEHVPTLDIQVNGRLHGQTAYLFQAVVDALLDPAPPASVPSLEDGLRNVRILDAVHRSASERRVVEL